MTLAFPLGFWQRPWAAQALVTLILGIGWQQHAPCSCSPYTSAFAPSLATGVLRLLPPPPPPLPLLLLLLLCPAPLSLPVPTSVIQVRVIASPLLARSLQAALPPGFWLRAAELGLEEPWVQASTGHPLPSCGRPAGARLLQPLICALEKELEGKNLTSLFIKINT